MPNVTICLSNTTTLAPVYGGGTPAYTYSWSNGATAGSITVGPASTTTYTVTVTDSKGCTLTQSVTVTVNPALTLIASNDSTICFGPTITLNAAASGGNGNYTISWNNGLATGSSVTMTLFGDTTLAIELTDNCGTPAQYDTIKVTVVPEIKASSIVNQNVSCFGGNDGSSTVTQTGGFAPFSYQWSNGATTATNANCSAGTYTITVTDSKGCTGTTTVTITEPPQLTIAPITGATICIGESSLIAPTYGGGTPGYQYLWSNGATTATINVSPIVTTSYTVTVTDTKNCTTTAVALITVRPPLSFTFVTPNTTICKGKTLTVTATVKGGDGNYQYSFNGGAFGAANSLTFLVTQDTIIYIVVKDSCTTPQITDTIEVISIDAPIVNFSWDPSAGCQPLTVIFKDSTKAVANSTYLWKFGDGNTSTLVNPVHVYKNYGIYDVSLTVTTPQGCETSLLKPQIIEVYERPVALFEWSPKDPSLFYPMVYFYDQSSGNPTQWTWTFGDSSLFSFEQNPNHQYEDTGKYVVTLLVSNQYGCTDSIEFIIEVKDNFTFYIPNTFTPNGDGKNDYFAVLGINYERFTTRILNRWGQPVFETNAPNFWDGNDFNGKESPQGTYVYVIEVFEKTGKKHTYRGNINLVR
ncbi:MAG: gliding motility-associated C-terminal domain-containing protein [Bacteroidetes bacterium]|nr:gliding motility-associated C-terminal domain-containing protein [Bacteroidota bacterium]